MSARSEHLKLPHLRPMPSSNVSTLFITLPCLDADPCTVLSCSSEPGPQIRVIVNDGVVPLNVLEGCPDNQHGMCPVDAFVQAQKENIRETDWNLVCNVEWEIPDGWNTTNGYPDWI